MRGCRVVGRGVIGVQGDAEVVCGLERESGGGEKDESESQERLAMRGKRRMGIIHG